MESLLDMLKSKSASDQARIEERRAAREDLSQQRDDALTAVTSKPKLYDRYLILQADNPQCIVPRLVDPKYSHKHQPFQKRRASGCSGVLPGKSFF